MQPNDAPVPKDPGLAALIEMLFGILFPLPGMGWIFAGHTTTGLNILMSYWIGLIAFVAAVVVVSVVTFGCATPVTIIWFPIHLFIALASTKKLNEYMTTGTTSPVNLPVLNIPLTPNATYQKPVAQPAPDPYQKQSYTPPSTEYWRPAKSTTAQAPQPQIIRRGMAGWQVVILLVLTVVATVSCVCSGLIGLAAIAQ